MKAVISIDHILERDHLIQNLEAVLSIFDDVTLVTFCHKEGAVLGGIETHKIYSSFLSRIVQTKEEFYKKIYTLPNTATRFTIKEDFDVYFSLSCGFAHGIEVNGRKPDVTYLLDWDSWENDLSLKGKLFKPYVNKWRLQALRDQQNIFSFSKFALEIMHFFLLIAISISPLILSY